MGAVTLPKPYSEQVSLNHECLLHNLLGPPPHLPSPGQEKEFTKRGPSRFTRTALIGQSIGLLRAMRANTAEKWLEERIKKYGPISKLSLFGQSAVFIMDRLQTSSYSPVMQHDQILKQYVGKMDAEVRKHLEMHWQGKQRVTTLTFNIICGLLFGVERGIRREKLVGRFQEMIEGIWSVPVNLPFTRYNRSLQASTKIQNMIKELMREKEVELEKGASPHQDLITCLLSIHGKNNEEVITEKEIVDNVMLVMVAGHDTSAVLITFLVRLLANDPDVYAAVLKEHEEIAKGKPSGEFLTWEDLAKMKYTWRVALETLRMVPPVFAGFRTVLKDIEFGGYLIPEGWKIFWATNMTHMDNSIFPEPTKFDPTRFENQASIPPYCFIPFGGGPRICPGIEFARIETLVTVHHLVTRFKWKLCHTDNFFGRNPTPAPTGGLPIEITSMNLM
ncbi:Cytochrome P450 716B1 [Vitis vinifera]|uniref:Beta-amyrin 28-monooxygenase n=1 Tax=Vitis vinifera TaxID=29760 RepID=A0A438ISD3_VITVI|nr:Cytochrome P450 716B1 [Vitis vinifera]